MRELKEGQARPGRCSTHPGVAAVGTCEVCGRQLCVSCAVPVRGTMVGPECLSSVLKDAPLPQRIPSPVRPVGSRLALIGFGLAVVVSILPWSQFGDGSRFFGAWTPHWSLIAVLGGVTGLLFALVVARRPLGPGIEAAVYGFLGLLIAATALIHHLRPPILSEATFWPWVAAVGGGLAVLGSMRRAKAVLEARRSNG